MSEQSGEFADFGSVIRERARRQPDRPALVFPAEGPQERGEIGRLTYGQLDLEARRIAAWLLQGDLPPGPSRQRVLILHDQGPLFIASFLGCLYAGAVAVPAPPPGGTDHHMERLLGIVKDAAVSVVLTDARHAPVVSQVLAGAGYGGLVCLATDRRGTTAFADACSRRMPAIAPDDVAFLQYTSGSTREPKGVMVSHRNLLANQRAIQYAMHTTDESVIGGWLPFHHDMGLVGHLLHPLWLGGQGVIMPSMSFVRRPVHWLRMVSDYGITTGGGPNFAYELCVRRVTDEQLDGIDLSRWRAVVNGAETVRAETLEAFAQRFAPVGLDPAAFYPCYGLAESTLLVTGGAPGHAPARLMADAAALEQHRLVDPVPGRPARTLISCGSPGPECEVRIVDPESGRELDPGMIGEIWIRSESVAGGYWNRTTETAEAFRAVTAGGEGGFLRTGDLGVVQDGELYVTGRIKDLLIVAGRNLYPQDVERTVQKVSTLFNSTVAFAVDSVREHVVVVQEVRSGKAFDADLPGLVSAVQQRVSREFEIPLGNVVLVRPGTVRRTTSGKVQRSAMRRLFLAGRLRPIHEVVDPEVKELISSSGVGGARGR
ncbi:fatty acyl-AMP ligase [Streptomyces sp. RB6PN25]|uniref:Fatty acyl-AMP ligase n=1 Tax=Streptomyces humicola TaxID=2953240 RepID=A0ABT1Q664_9ACTN|nr:fatty acyl-AMP ligase [Streptomyces humicola]MCQ4084277.1 fatty acyl-AMP ligase [Streptomyces humicola]